MRSKTSKHPKLQFPSKVVIDCSEEELTQAAKNLAFQLRAGDRVLLEGPMGVGKTTFARALLEGLQIQQPPEGSPTFAIAHEYETPDTSVVHIDFYRIRFEAEIDEAGIPSYFWERDLIVITEWLSSWPEFEEQVIQSGRIFQVKLEYLPEADQSRKLQISQLRTPTT